MDYKKGISPVISLILLLVVSVGLIGTAYTFLSNYTQSNIEEANDEKFKFSNVDLKSVYELEDDLFLEFDLQNQNDATVDYVELSGERCELNLTVSRGINVLNISQCNYQSSEGIISVEIFTDVGQFNDFFLVENGSIKFTSTSYFQYWNQSGNSIYYNRGTVGIGDSTPDNSLRLDVEGRDWCNEIL